LNAFRILALVLLGGVTAVSSALGDNEAKRFTVTSSLDGKKVLPLRIHWIAQLPHQPFAGFGVRSGPPGFEPGTGSPQI
jgi:hypothetical protein